MFGIRDVSIETRLALALCWPGGRGEQQVIACLNAGVDWDALEAFARPHQLLSFFYPYLATWGKKGAPESVQTPELVQTPEAVLERYLAVYQVNIQRSVRLGVALLEVKDLLAASGVEMAAMRGPALASSVYDDPGLRIFSDLDVLVDPMDFPRCYQALRQAGWQPAFELSERERRWIARGDRDFGFSKGQEVLEVHWQVDEKAYSFPLSASDFLAARQPARLLDSEVYGFTPPYTLLLLCMHGARHQWEKLVWAMDIAWLVNRQADLDWGALWEWVGGLGLRRVTAMGLLMSEAVGGVPAPQAVREACWGDARAVEIVRRVLERSLSVKGERKVTGYQRALQEMAYDLKARERLEAKVYMLLDRLFTPRQSDWRWVRLSEGLYGLYSLLRPLRLLLAAVKMLIGKKDLNRKKP